MGNITEGLAYLVLFAIVALAGIGSGILLYRKTRRNHIRESLLIEPAKQNTASLEAASQDAAQSAEWTEVQMRDGYGGERSLSLTPSTPEAIERDEQNPQNPNYKPPVILGVGGLRMLTDLEPKFEAESADATLKKSLWAARQSGDAQSIRQALDLLRNTDEMVAARNTDTIISTLSAWLNNDQIAREHPICAVLAQLTQSSSFVNANTAQQLRALTRDLRIMLHLASEEVKQQACSALVNLSQSPLFKDAGKTQHKAFIKDLQILLQSDITETTKQSIRSVLTKLPDAKVLPAAAIAATQSLRAKPLSPPARKREVKELKEVREVRDTREIRETREAIRDMRETRVKEEVAAR